MGVAIPDSLREIELEIKVAGKRISHTFAPEPNLDYIFTWDGSDMFGRFLQGEIPITIRIGYKYQMFYAQPPAPPSFGRPSGKLLASNVPSIAQTTLWQEHQTHVSRWDARGQGLGGWTFDIHHAYSPLGGTLYLGNGQRRQVENLPLIIKTIAGTGEWEYSDGDGGTASEARLAPTELLVGFDGSIYFIDLNAREATGNPLIRKIDPSGIIRTVAGGGDYPVGGDDGALATKERFTQPQGLALGPDGSLYIAEFARRVRCVKPDGTITTVAGTGQHGFSGDGGPAIEAQLASSSDIALAPDGSLYIAEGPAHRIRKVNPGGIIYTIAGTGIQGFSGDGGPAAEAQLSYPNEIDIGPDGSLYIADVLNRRIRRINPNGIIETVVGDGQPCEPATEACGDGGLAIEAQLPTVYDIDVGPDGSILISGGGRIRLVNPAGVITTVAGMGQSGFSGDGGPATRADLSFSVLSASFGTGWLYLSRRWDKPSNSSNHPFLPRILRK